MFGDLIECLGVKLPNMSLINQGRKTPPAGGGPEPGLRKISPEIYSKVTPKHGSMNLNGLRRLE